MRKRKNSLRLSIIISFIVIIFSTFFIIGLLVFTNWKSSAKAIALMMNKETAEDIERQIDDFVNTPLYLNEVNHTIIEKAIIDLNNKKEREIFFAGTVKANQDEIYSFSFGSESGEYYGARRNKENNIEIIENNETTGGNSRYYSTTKDLTSDKLVEETSKFDPRTRDWYKAAKEKQKPVFSPIYEHFVMNDLAISAAYPIYNNDGILRGVLGTHITLSKINNYLKEISDGKGSISYIVEKSSGYIIANSLEKPNFYRLSNNRLTRITIDEVASKSIINAYTAYKESSQDSFDIKETEGKFNIKITEYNREELNWLIITAVPESLFTAEITKNIQISIFLSIIALLIAIIVYMKNTEVFLKPIYDLIYAAENFSKGDLLHRAKIFRNDEIGMLSNSFNNMAEQLYSLINTLERKVKDRTIELEKTNEEITYLSYHDQLTGLYNRRYFEEALKRLDAENNYPLTIVMADMNGLKLVNDSLGHALGDELLKKAADVLKEGCRSSDVIARLGGDEFTMIFPKAGTIETEQILKRIRVLASKEKITSVDLSISFGYATKRNNEENIEDIFKKAEDYMYNQKLFEGPHMRGKTIDSIINILNEKNKIEEKHSRRVSEICKSIGEALCLNESEIKELETVGLLHDIGKIAISDDIFNNAGKLTDEEWQEIKRHPEIGYRILSTVNDVADLAQYVLAHHERWDGKGYPKGLKETEIPLQSRIIAIADAYEAMTSERTYRDPLPKDEVIERLQESAGIQFDPKLLNIFIEKVLDKLLE